MPAAPVRDDRDFRIDEGRSSIGDSYGRGGGDARRAASLRRIAIVLKDLPSAVASQLLGSLDTATAARLRREVRELADVDPMERKRAIESFTGSLRRQVRRDNDSPSESDELQLSSRAERSTTPLSVPMSFSSSPLGFLNELADDDLLSMLLAEHPQTIAVVIASLAPARAAKLIPQMPPRSSQEVLSRIGRLQDIPQEMLREIAASFVSRAESLVAGRQKQQLQQWLGPLLQGSGAMTGQQAANVAGSVPPAALAVSPRLRAILAELPGQPNQPTSVNRPSSIDRPESPASESELRLRQATQSEPTMASRSTDDIHLQLISLRPKDLCQALARVPTRTAILALVGLPNKTSDAAIAILPRAQANQVRSQIASLDSMELREIDEAKAAVAHAAMIREKLEIPSQTNAPDATSRPRFAVA